MNRLFHLIITVALCSSWPAAVQAADRFIVKDGHAEAQIVISASAKRTTRLAAQQLQDYIQKITGAHVPIVTAPAPDAVKICVGPSPVTDALHLTITNLQDGAFRIVSGPDWLALLGQDTEFEPTEPWARNNSDLVSGKIQREWDQVTGDSFGLPDALIYKSRFRLAGDTGLPDDQREAGKKLPPLVLWDFDEHGTLNAVCGFLRSLGVRWYAPGELGEVVPVLKTLALPAIDRTTRPDFPVRRVNVHTAVHGLDMGLWVMHLGARDPYGFLVAHGLDHMTNRPEVFARHPDWFAMQGGQRLFRPHENNQLCYSNEEFFRATVRYVCDQFDHYHIDAASVMPPDGMVAICQCPLCKGKDTPDRGPRGLGSDYVWDFVNRVAKEVRKTHPDKKIVCCAYGIYSLPPLNIAKLEPNVIVAITGARRPVNNLARQQEDCRELRESWLSKTDNPIVNFENYPFTDRGWYLPSFTFHNMGQSINALKGICQGEDIWLSVRPDFEKVNVAFNQFLVYFTQRMYWDGKGADVDAMLKEYCRLFYGPAGPGMLDFFNYCEANWQMMEQDKSRADAALALFEKAKASADASSLYGRRLAQMDDYLNGLRSKSRQLATRRGPVPVLRLVNEARGEIVIDGKLDEDAWIHCPAASTCRLRELETGRTPILGTTVKAQWQNHHLYLAIRCDEHPGDKLNVTSNRRDDSAIWMGDVVEVLIETDAHSYYQIAVNPAGAVADLDRGANRESWFGWDSQAQVATRIADDHWDIEMRIPVSEDPNDPLHQVIGHKPTQSLPWHINVCRQRIREDGRECSAFSPTGADTFHDVMKFATFYDGRAQTFEATDGDDDFLTAATKASHLSRTGKRPEALAAWIAAADKKSSDWQRSYALESAIDLACDLGHLDSADQLAARIPIEPVKKCARMRIFLTRSQAAQIIDQFGGENIGAWPFWQRGEAYALRGRAYLAQKQNARAKEDLANALAWTGDARARTALVELLKKTDP